MKHCPNPTDMTPCRTYTVEGGDFLDGIALMYKTNIDKLLEVNEQLAADAPLQKGMRVRTFAPPCLTI